MALEDRYIFTAIFAKYSDQPIEFVMEQYEKAKLLNMAIEKRLWDQSRVVACPASESPAQKEEKKPEKPQDRVPEKKCYTQKDLKCDPAEAITDTSVTCCLSRMIYPKPSVSLPVLSFSENVQATFVRLSQLTLKQTKNFLQKKHASTQSFRSILTRYGRS